MNFSGTVALVADGSRRVGRAVARMLAEHSAQVVLALPEYIADAELPDGIVVHQIAMNDHAAVNEIVTSTLQQYGRLDILVTCFLNAQYAPFAELTTEEWRASLSANLDPV